MNERIRELAEQAGFYVAGSKIYIPSTSEDITTCQKKFAELIVRECIECADTVGKANLASAYPNSTSHHIKQKIKQHFGVEE